MKRLVILFGENCGYCKKAKMLVRRAIEKEPDLGAVDIRFVKDDSDAGRAYSHTLVPAFFCNGVLVFEGNPDIDTVSSIIRNCCD